jgi:hypothetical protein
MLQIPKYHSMEELLANNDKGVGRRIFLVPWRDLRPVR